MKVGLSFPVQRIAGRGGEPAGLVFQENHGVLSGRRFVDTTRAPTAPAEIARSRWAEVASKWADVSEEEREGWNEWARRFDRQSWFGAVAVSGHAAFTKVNVFYRMATGAWKMSAPTGEPDLVITELVGLTWFEDQKKLYFEVYWTGTGGLGPMGCEMTQGRPSANWIPRESDYRLLNGPTADSLIGGATSPTTWWRGIDVPEPVNDYYYWLRVSYWRGASWPGAREAARLQMSVVI